MSCVIRYKWERSEWPIFFGWVEALAYCVLKDEQIHQLGIYLN
ncbi:hypothetical protein [Maribacter arcticus]|nr:hypothetical protein [Maribacter arcticus]